MFHQNLTLFSRDDDDNIQPEEDQLKPPEENQLKPPEEEQPDQLQRPEEDQRPEEEVMEVFDFFAALNRMEALVVLNRPQVLGPALPLDFDQPTPEPEPEAALDPAAVVVSLDRMERDVDRVHRQQQPTLDAMAESDSQRDLIRYMKLVEKAFHDSSRLARQLATELADKSSRLIELQVSAHKKLDAIQDDANKTLHPTAGNAPV